VFHFNKASLADSTIPAWVFKVDGQTHYVHHAVFEVGFSTKETPNNPHTKGSLKTKGYFEVREENGLKIGYVMAVTPTVVGPPLQGECRVV
jgi:hypothetical protein